MKDQLGLMQRIKLVEREERPKVSTAYRGAVYDFVTIAEGEDLTAKLSEGWDDLTDIIKPEQRPDTGRVVGHRVTRS